MHVFFYYHLSRSMTCYLKECGLPPHFKESWCDQMHPGMTEIPAVMQSDYCKKSEENCSNCNGVWSTSSNMPAPKKQSPEPPKPPPEPEKPPPTFQPMPTPTKIKEGGCDCDWATQDTCGKDDDSLCWSVCCSSKQPDTLGNSNKVEAKKPDKAVNPDSFNLPSSGTLTHYWDCCKSACSWSDNPNGAHKECINNGDGTGPMVEASDQRKSTCDGGESAMCASQYPFVKKYNGENVLFGTVARNNPGKGACGVCWEVVLVLLQDAKT
jgi:hypothetical protein